jgi:hypothetical protein
MSNSPSRERWSFETPEIQMMYTDVHGWQNDFTEQIGQLVSVSDGNDREFKELDAEVIREPAQKTGNEETLGWKRVHVRSSTENGHSWQSVCTPERQPMPSDINGCSGQRSTEVMELTAWTVGRRETAVSLQTKDVCVDRQMESAGEKDDKTSARVALITQLDEGEGLGIQEDENDEGGGAATDAAVDLAAGEALMEKTEEKSKGEKLGRFASDQRRPRHTRVGVLDPETEPVRLLSFGHSVDGENHTGIMTGRLGVRPATSVWARNVATADAEEWLRNLVVHGGVLDEEFHQRALAVVMEALMAGLGLMMACSVGEHTKERGRGLCKSWTTGAHEEWCSQRAGAARASMWRVPGGSWRRDGVLCRRDGVLCSGCGWGC